MLEILKIEELDSKEIAIIDSLINSKFSYRKHKTLSREKIKTAINQSKWGDIYFIEHEDKIIGFFSIHIRKYGIFLHKLYISKNNQKQGFGSLIIEYLKEKADEIRLRVNINNNAILFYEKMNFKNIRKKDKFFTMVWKKRN